MKKDVFIILALLLIVSFLGCAKKQQSLEEMQAPMPIESLGTVSTETSKPAQETKTAALQSMPEAASKPIVEPKLEPLPPPGPYKPLAREIQAALKNAGFYTGAVDGKSGPMTKKAIEEFQKMNKLDADGKVGSKTWAVLSKYLNAVSQEPTSKPKR